MLPRSRACGARAGLAFRPWTDRGRQPPFPALPPTPAPEAPCARPHQEAEGVLDFLQHVRVLGLAGRLGPQRQEAFWGWGGAGKRSASGRGCAPETLGWRAKLAGRARGDPGDRGAIWGSPWGGGGRDPTPGRPSPPASRRRVLRPRSLCSSTRAASADFCSFDTKLSTSSNTWFRMSWRTEQGTRETADPGPASLRAKPSSQGRSDTPQPGHTS